MLTFGKTGLCTGGRLSSIDHLGMGMSLLGGILLPLSNELYRLGNLIILEVPFFASAIPSEESVSILGWLLRLCDKTAFGYVLSLNG